MNFCVSVGSSSSYNYLFPFCFFVVSEGETLEREETRHPRESGEGEGCVDIGGFDIVSDFG